jgi:hypothetical protein
MRKWSFALALGLGIAALAGCEPGFEPPSKVTGLRVLAVRPEPASGSPGVPVALSMLVADGKTEPDEPERPLQIAWLLGCHNPPTRLYYGCMPILRELAKGIDDPSSVPPGTLAFGRDVELLVPDDILSAAPRVPTDPVHFGVSYAFFAVCAGQLRPRPDVTDRVPLDCVDPATGQALGASDFVLGFATVYSYEGSVNASPALESLTFDAVAVPDPACAAGDESCLPRVAACTLEDRGKCPAHRVRPRVTPESAERLGDVGEILWASYYASAGTFATPTQLVNDRATGLVADYSGTFRPPAEPGPVRIWVTVNDQRGGATWQTFDVLVE